VRVILLSLLLFPLSLFANDYDDANKVFEFAEKNYSEFFRSFNTGTYRFEDYWLRYYSETENYIGTKNGDIYVYGDIFNGLLKVGKISDYIDVTPEKNVNTPVDNSSDDTPTINDKPVDNNSDDTPTTNDKPDTSVNNNNEDALLANLFNTSQSNVQVKGSGTVITILADDLEGDRHQRFILKLASGQTLLMAHNIDLAPKILNLSVNDSIDFFGEYEWNDKGGVIHWTHDDLTGIHENGWLLHHDIYYQ
jgi:hypothetical protein